ncbi:MAG: hypothetical protein R3B83_01585 [Nitrospirales bacterium]|nr:hypothetical protein [Nitrospirales bacterium]
MSVLATLTPTNGTTTTAKADPQALIAPTSIKETGLPEELLVQLLNANLIYSGRNVERTAEVMKLPVV